MSNLELSIHLLPLELWNTVYMVFASAFFGLVIGLPIGILLTISDHGHIRENSSIYKFFETIVNIGRSFPFAILLVVLIPVTRAIVGTSIGTTASIVPLSIAAAPFIARIVETSLKEVDPNLIEAAIVMGSTTWQIITKVLLIEALPSLIQGITLAIVNLVGYSAMAGLVGGGGLGEVAIHYGYYRFNTTIMIETIILILLLVQAIQWISGKITQYIYQRRRQTSP